MGVSFRRHQLPRPNPERRNLPLLDNIVDMAGNLKRRDVFGDVSFMDITPDDAYMSSEADMSDNSSSYSFMPMGEDENRVESPKTIMDVPRIFTGRNSPSTPKTDKSVEGDDDNGEKRVTIWNWREKRKLSGNSAPFKKNLHEYLRKHPDWEEYRGQDKDMNGKKLSPKKRREQNANSTPSTPQATPTKAPMPEPAKHHLPEPVDISDAVPIFLQSTDDAAKTRTQEMAARRRSIEEEEARQRREEQDAETKRIAEAMEVVRRSELQRATAWKAAQQEAQRIQAERDVSKLQAEQSKKKKRQIEDEQNQQAVITQAVSRVATWKRIRLSGPEMGLCF